MKQTLYLIKDNQRVELDTGNGNITMQYCNPLFAGLNKVKFSRSFSFSLPLTQRNIQAFDLFGEMGYKSSSYGKMYDAEYWIDGFPSITGARLYVLSLSNNAYQCTLIVADSAILDELKDGGLKLRDIGKSTDWVDWSPECYQMQGDAYFNSSNAVCYPIFNAGVKCFNAEGNLIQANVDEVKRDIAPPPCIQVSAILNRLAEMGIDWRAYYTTFNGTLSFQSEDYDIDKDGRDDMMVFGVVPLVETAVSQSRGAEKWVNKYWKPFFPGYEPSINPDYDEEETFEYGGIEEILAVFELDRRFATLTGYKVQQGGHVVLQVEGVKFPLDIAENIDNIAVVQVNKDSFGNYVIARTITTLAADYVGNVAVYDGTIELSEVEERNTSISIGLKINSLVPNLDIDPPSGATITESVYYDDGFCTHPIFWPDCLPDVSVWDFLKMLLTYYRAVPDAKPNTILRYSELKRNLDNGHFTDWSGKMIAGNGWQKYDQYALSIDGLAQHNYYLMANEETDKSEGGGYEVVKCEFMSENPWVEKSAEQFKSAFYAAFKTREEYPLLDTGGTIDFWKPTDWSGYNVERGDAKPAIGRVCKKWTEVGNKPYLSMFVANLPTDLWRDTLQKWLRRPEVIKSKFNLNLFDLQDAQRWETPIFVKELNGVFAVVKIDYKAGSVADVELLKLL